jgi:hypothetical protein
VPDLEQEDLQHLAQLALGISIPAPLRELDPGGGSGQVVVQVAKQVHPFAPFGSSASLPTLATWQTGGGRNQSCSAAVASAFVR